MSKVTLSIIIVNYNNKQDLFHCIDSLYSKKVTLSTEVIVVDNSEVDTLSKELRKKYKNIIYIKSRKNIGYGAGMNLGAKYAKGKYLFILNPDTIFQENIIGRLISRLEKDKKIGMVAPLLVSPSGETLEQGARELTPTRALFKLSFIDKIWKNNPVSKNYWVKKWDDKRIVTVDNVPGSAFVIRNNLFKKIGGFDKNFFLYFEEFDLCKRVREAGYEICIDSSTKLVHKWETTTRHLKNKDKIFKKSRFYYFRKHFGFLNALVIEFFLGINFWNTVLIATIILAALVRFYKIDTLIPFYPDIGWYYISARDMLMSGQIPLVGITSSHLWLHQGPLWTYVLGFLFYFYNFNPISPAYFTAILDLFTLTLLYKLVKYAFNKHIALIASVLYAFSPIVILSARTPYHTSPIPFFVILFIYSLFKWTNGSVRYFPILIFSIAILYNLHLQSIIFAAIFVIVFVYGFYKKADWYKSTLNLKIAAVSALAFIIPMIPILIYDFKNGFPQTVVFTGWLFYKLFSFIIPSQGLSYGVQTSEMLNYFYHFFQKLLFLPGGMIAAMIILTSIVMLAYKVVIKKERSKPYVVLLFLNITLLISTFLTKSPADAYLMTMFVPIILIVSLLLSFIASKINYVLILLVVVTISVTNIYVLVSNDYYLGLSKQYGPTFKDRINAAKYIVDKSEDENFAILGRGEGSEFESYTMGYSFLTWYLGKGPSKKYDLLYIIEESPTQIKIERKEL